eukprot:12905693-Prorocentrum_lima.AAC.1
MAKTKDHDAVFVYLVAKTDSANTYRSTAPLAFLVGALKQRKANDHFEQLLDKVPLVAWGVP